MKILIVGRGWIGRKLESAFKDADSCEDMR